MSAHAYVADPDFMLYVGDVREVLRELPVGSVDCCVTSPPYLGLRDYGHESQIGLEGTIGDYVSAMVDVFREVRRVLTPTATCWINLGDSYANKQRQMMPARVALALQADGWWLRSEVVWFKPNPMPSSVTDRPTDAHEMVYLFAKNSRYFFDQEAVREPGTGRETFFPINPRPGIDTNGGNQGNGQGNLTPAADRNVRSVWTIATQPYPDAHFATFPEALPERCIKASCPERGTVLDPFLGSGTTALVARRLGRKCVGIELNEEYARLAARRLSQLSLLAEGAA